MQKEVADFAQTVADQFSDLAQVVAVVLAGSQTNLVADRRSDLDFYVYISEEIPTQIRTAIAQKFAVRVEINNQYWENGDEWIVTESGIGIDIMYRDPAWIEAQLDAILVKHQPRIGYTTCFWSNVLHSQILYDKMGWFRQLQSFANQPYPEPLRKAIVAKNYPILRRNISSYLHQIELAIERRDYFSINHRITALLASYFDIIFAVNYVPHPGEKRLVEFVKQLCPKYPSDMENHLSNLLNQTDQTGCLTFDSSQLSDRPLNLINALIDSLDELLITENLNDY